MSHEDSEYGPLDCTWRVTFGSGAVVRTGPHFDDQVAGPPLCYGTVVHPAGKPLWMTLDDFQRQPVTYWGQDHWILRLPIWMGKHCKHKDEMFIAWATIGGRGGYGPPILEEHEKEFQ